MLKVHVLFEHSRDLQPHGCSHIRLLLPLAHPANAGAWRLTQGVDYAGGADVVIVERTWRPGPGLRAAAEALVDRVRREGACLIYTLDDNLLDLRPRPLGPAGLTEAQASTVRFLAREADGIIVSTQPLQSRLAALNPRIIVVPNALDERLFAAAAGRPRASEAGGPLVIGLMGTRSHDADLQLILEPLRAVLRRQAGRAQFELIGGLADPAWLQAFAGLPIRVRDAGRPVAYPDFARWLAAETAWDIGLAPLEDTAFTRAKSDIKFLDYCALGAVAVCSDGPAYAGTVRHGETGWLAGPAEAWGAALERLAADAGLRRQLAENGRRYLWETRVLRAAAPAWRQAIHSIMRGMTV